MLGLKLNHVGKRGHWRLEMYHSWKCFDYLICKMSAILSRPAAVIGTFTITYRVRMLGLRMWYLCTDIKGELRRALFWRVLKYPNPELPTELWRVCCGKNEIPSEKRRNCNVIIPSKRCCNFVSTFKLRYHCDRKVITIAVMSHEWHGVSNYRQLRVFL